MLCILNIFNYLGKPYGKNCMWTTGKGIGSPGTYWPMKKNRNKSSNCRSIKWNSCTCPVVKWSVHTMHYIIFIIIYNKRCCIWISTHLFFLPLSINPITSLTSVTICLVSLSTYTPSSRCSRTTKKSKGSNQWCKYIIITSNWTEDNKHTPN